METDYGIKGCEIIYQPAGQAGEYSRLACNPYRGCGHGCVYCYVPSVIRISREEFDAGAEWRKDFIKRLRRDAAKYRDAGCTEQILIAFTTDPYHPGDTGLTNQVIHTLREFDLSFCTLTKGGTRALRDLHLFRSGLDAFASSLTSLDDAMSLEWE